MWKEKDFSELNSGGGGLGAGEIVSIQTTQFVIVSLMNVCPQNDTCHLLVNVPHSAPHNAICPGLTVIQPALIQSAPCHHVPFVRLPLSICLSSLWSGWFCPTSPSIYVSFNLLSSGNLPRREKMTVSVGLSEAHPFFRKVHLFGYFHHFVFRLCMIVFYHRMT